MGTYTNLGFRSCAAMATADLRNHLSDVKDGLVGSGWAVASDTGQVDVATVTAPGSADTSIGYQMFYLNDSQHGSYPIYMKRTYRTSTASGGRLRTQFSVGVATNGSGTFVNTPTWSLTEVNVGSSAQHVPSATPATFLGSYGEGYSTTVEGVGMYGAATTTTPVLSVSREFDQTTGEVGTTGNFSVFFSPVSTATFPTAQYCIGYNRAFNKEYAFALSTSVFHTHVPMQTGFVGSQVELYPMFHRLRNAVIAPAICSYRNADIATDSTVTATVLGVSHTYRATGIPQQTSNTAQSHSVALLWE